MINIDGIHGRCSSDSHLATEELDASVKDAATHHHQQQLDLLRPQASPRRYSCPPRSVLCPSNDDDVRHTETSTESQEESQEMSRLLLAVENFLHNLLVRSNARFYA